MTRLTGAKSSAVVVTISREYGAAGQAVADGVAHALGYDVLTDDLPRVVAANLGISATEVAARTDAPASFGERVLGGLDAGSPEMHSPATPALPGDLDEAMRREIERTIVARADRGNVVILGRNGGSVLVGRSDLVRVFLTGDREWRVARLVESLGTTRAEARADIERVDAARNTFARDRYKTRWGDARSYDLTIDVSRFGIAATIDLIVAATRGAERRT